jgi:hypothetical protein
MTYNFFIVCVQVIDESGEVIEDFSTLTYPGYLPGFTSGYNKHGIVYSCNTICPRRTFARRSRKIHMTLYITLYHHLYLNVGGMYMDNKNYYYYNFYSAVSFICRTLLSAKTKDECLKILKDEGVGIGDGFSLNLISVKEGPQPIVCNIEIAPNQHDGNESEISILEVESGTSLVHCNKYMLKTNVFYYYTYFFTQFILSFN